MIHSFVETIAKSEIQKGLGKMIQGLIEVIPERKMREGWRKMIQSPRISFSELQMRN